MAIEVPENESRYDFEDRANRDLNRARNLYHRKEYGFKYSFFETWQSVVKSLKDKLNSIHWFRHIFGIGKKKHTGRFGGKMLQKDDAISQLGEGNGPYFNPFENMDGEKGFNYSEDEETSILQQAFRSRAYDQKALARKNDFEDKYYTDDAKALDFLQLANLRSKEASEYYLKTGLDYEEDEKTEDVFDKYDLEIGFEPDEPLKEGNPSKFKMAIRSAVTIQDYFYEISNRYTSTKSKSANKTGNQRNREIRAAQDYVLMNSAAYKEVYAKGKAEAEAAGMVYDPKADPNIWMLTDAVDTINLKSTGHAALALRTYDNNDDRLSSYSFGFAYGTERDTGAAGVVRGEVRNPDPMTMSYGREEPISYSGYLKAAAKIRGIRASGRTYSTLGYNCTSFVQDIAQEAGVNIPIEESTGEMITNFSKHHRLDSPYSLALWIRNRNLSDISAGGEVDYFRLAKSPVIQESVAGISTLLSDMLKRDRNNPEDFKQKFAGRWEALMANNKAIPDGTSLDDILKNVKSLYDDIMLDGLSELAKGRNNKFDAQKEKAYLDLVNQKESRLNERFGTTSIIEFINRVVSTEEGYMKYQEICGINSNLINGIKPDSDEMEAV